MKTRSFLQRRNHSESSDRLVANIKPRSWSDPPQQQAAQPQPIRHDFSHVDLFAHDPGPRTIDFSIQPKLTVGAPNDQYEQEADRVADQVMAMPDTQPSVQREGLPEEEEALQTKALGHSIQREAMPDEEEDLQTKPLAATITPLVQREALPEEEEVQAKALGHSIQREALPEEDEELQTKPLGGSIQREALPDEEEEPQTKPLDHSIQREAMPDEEELQAKPLSHSIQREALLDEDEELQTKPLGHSIQREAMPEEEEIQTKRSPTPHSLLPTPSLESRLSSSQGGGSPLPHEVRSFMEPRFGANFSQVRVHTGSDSVQMNRDLSAQAFTHKQDVYFGAGKAPAKDALTAHELTHVVQQNPGVVSRKPVVPPTAVPNVSAAIQRTNASTSALGTSLIQRQLMSVQNLTDPSKGGATPTLPSTYKDIVTALKDYHDETQGKKRILVRKQLLEKLSGYINRWVAKNPTANTTKAVELATLQGQVKTELQSVGNELVALKNFDATKDDPSSPEQKPRTLDSTNAPQIPDLNRMWTKEEFDRFTYESVTAGQGGISKKIGNLLDEYHANKKSYDEAYKTGETVEKTLKILTASVYKKQMDDVILYRIRMETWIAMIKGLATSWLTGHEGDSYRQNRYLAMLKFIAICQTVADNLVKDYPLLPEHPEIDQSLVIDKTLISGKTGAYKQPEKIDDLKKQLKFTTPEEEKAFDSNLTKYITLSKKYEGSFDSVLTKLAPLIDASVPNYRDKSELKADLLIPIPKSYGIAALAITVQLKLENKEKDKIKVHGNFSLGAGAQFPPEFKPVQGYLRAELGAYIEAQGQNSREVMMLFSYGLYRRFRESNVIPHALTDAMWGKGKSSVAKYRSAEQWAAAVEKDIFGSKMGLEKPDDLYVDTGGLGRGKGLIKGDAGIVTLGASGEVIGTSGKRYNSKTVEAAIKKRTGQTGNLGELLGKGAEKYSKSGSLKSGAQKPRGKHHVTFTFDANGNFKVKQFIGVNTQYKHTREYTGDDDRTVKWKGGWLAKTKHEFNFTIFGMVASSLMGLTDPVMQGLQGWTKLKETNKDPQDKAKTILRIKNIFETVLGGVADPLAHGLITSSQDKTLLSGLTDAIADPGIGLDISIEYKWAKDDDVPTEQKIEIDLRNVQEIKFKPGAYGAQSVIGSHTEFKYSKRAGVFGAVVKAKPVKNSKKPGDYELVREDVLTLINKKEPGSLEAIIFDSNKKATFDKYVKEADEEMKKKKENDKKVDLTGGFNESTSPLPRR